MTVAKLVPPSELVGYDEDVHLWSQQQARLLREGRFAEIDIEHLADEIEDVGKSEKRELASRFAVLLVHLLKWTEQPSLRGSSWRLTIKDQRRRIALAIKATPSLKTVLADPEWREDVWLEALSAAQKETALAREALPDVPPWSLEKACESDFWPD
jgi:hypothetical protein